MVMTDKEIKSAALEMWHDVVHACTKEEMTNCNCVTNNLNAMSYMTPIGENTQTRKIFKDMLGLYGLFKKRGVLTNCTKKLRPL